MRRVKGLTLVEVMITLVIFIILAGFTLMAVREVVTQWTLGERRRVLYEKAAGVIDTMSDDLRLTLTQEPAGVTEVKVRFIGDYEPGTNHQRMMFVRAFEAGPERAITNTEQAMYTPENEADDPKAKKPALAVVNTPDYTGLKLGNFKPLGGMAMVGYYVKDQILYRAIHAPVPGVMSAELAPDKSQIVATDVLYFSLDYWSQYTQTWEHQPPHSKTANTGPERVWDSTRGISAPPLNKFILHRSAESLNDPEDDVFPEKIKVTLTIDSTMPRCVFTKLVAAIGESDTDIEVDNTKGFSDGDDENAYILIDDEWIQIKKRTPEHFEVAERGARNTLAKGHVANSVVRTGKTFSRVIYIPNWRSDFTSDAAWRARHEKYTPMRILR